MAKPPLTTCSVQPSPGACGAAWNNAIRPARAQDAVQGIALYDACLDLCRLRLPAVLGQRAFHRLWPAIAERDTGLIVIATQIDCVLFKKFCSTLNRRVFKSCR